MKICFITNLYKPFNRGGAEKIIENLAKKLSLDHEIIILTTAPLSSLKKFNKTTTKIKIYYLFNWNIYHPLNDYKYPKFIRLFWHLLDLFNFIIWQKTKKIIIQEKPDLIFTHNLKGYSLGLPIILKKLKIKHVHTLHDAQLIDPSGNLYRSKTGNLTKLTFGLKIYTYFTKRFYQDLHYVISPSHFLLKQHQSFGFFPQAKTINLVNPVSDLINDNQKAKHNNFNLLYLGQLEQHKGIIFLIKAFKKITNPNINLYVAGRGRGEKEIKKLINGEQKIKFFGYLQPQEVAEIMKIIDLVIVPSLCYENSPTVIYESYSRGIPVLVADSGGSPELVEQNKTGLIFKTGEEKDLLAKINYVYNNQNLLNSWSNNCLEKVKDFGVEKYLNRVFDFIGTNNSQITR